jgi:hypothetical protein
MKTLRLLGLLAVLCVVSLVLAGCGDDNDETGVVISSTDLGTAYPHRMAVDADSGDMELVTHKMWLRMEFGDNQALIDDGYDLIVLPEHQLITRLTPLPAGYAEDVVLTDEKKLVRFVVSWEKDSTAILFDAVQLSPEALANSVVPTEPVGAPIISATPSLPTSK